MMGGIKAQYDCIKAFSETEFYEDLQIIDAVLVMHGKGRPDRPLQLAEQDRSSC
jgi:hypothetical protein